MAFVKEVSLRCDGPRCDERITQLSHQTVDDVFEDADGMWWHVTNGLTPDGYNEDLWFHDEQCLKRYFREKSKRPQTYPEVLEQQAADFEVALQ